MRLNEIKEGEKVQRRFKVFISSTYEDLKQERLDASLEVLKLGHIPFGMELFIAGRSSIDIIEEAIKDCDVYVLICGKVYGSIYQNDQSYTDYEYEYAKKLNKPRFSIVQKLDDTEDISDKQKVFRMKVLNEQCEFFANSTELTNKLATNLHVIIEKYRNSMNGYLDYKELTEYKNLKSFVFLKDRDVYKSISSILELLDNNLYAVLTNIMDTDIIETTFSKLKSQIDIENSEVFIQDNLNEKLREIIILLNSISVDKKSNNFINGTMDPNIIKLKEDRVRQLIDNIQYLKNMIKDQSYYYSMNSSGGGVNV